MRYIITLSLFLFFTSCIRDDANFEMLQNIDYTEENELEIQNYLTEHQLKAQKTESGLYYIIDELGKGSHPSSSDNVTIYYKGYYTNNTVFDESETQKGTAFFLNQVIEGWTEGIPFFKTGGKGTLIIPSDLAYGNRGIGSIPPGAVLLFDIHLISINN